MFRWTWRGSDVWRGRHAGESEESPLSRLEGGVNIKSQRLEKGGVMAMWTTGVSAIRLLG